MTQSELMALIRAHKAAVLALDGRALKEQSDAYQIAEKAILASLKRLLDQRTTAEANGESVGVAWLLQGQRLTALLDQARAEIDRYATSAASDIAGYQRDSALMAESQVEAAIRAQLDPSIADIASRLALEFNRLPTEAISNLVGAMGDGTPLGKRLAQLAPTAVQNIKSAIIGGVALGKGPRGIARDVSAAAKVSRNDALRVCRTETLRAFREVTRQSFVENADVLDSWTWLATLSSRTCAVCIAMNGTVHPIDEPMASHICCRCVQVPNTKSWEDILGPEDAEGLEDTRPVIETGESWFQRQDAAKQDNILGKDAGAAYRAGDVGLSDFAGVKHSDEWGDSVYTKSLKAALSDAQNRDS